MKQARHATQERLALALVVFGVVLLAGSCSFMLDTSTTQCQSDKDCQRFAGAVCDPGKKVCVASRDAGVSDASVSDASTAIADVNSMVDTAEICTGPGGCFSCTPSNETQILSHCTDTVCVPFDNKRLTLLGDDGGLRPLPQ
jgi:hypothetical protein